MKKLLFFPVFILLYFTGNTQQVTDGLLSIYRKIGVINSRDQAMAAKEIQKWDFVDAERIGVWGWSGGGSRCQSIIL